MIEHHFSHIEAFYRARCIVNRSSFNVDAWFDAFVKSGGRFGAQL